MQLSCPQCRKRFEFEDENFPATIECDQCGKSFTPEESDGETLPQACESEAIAPPVRSEPRIWPWLFTLLLLISAVGVWVQKDAWLDNRWMRSTLINLQLPLENREKDWAIIPESVHIRWIDRDDGSRVMVVAGAIENLLESSVAYPDIEITFYANDQPDLIVATRRMQITEVPDDTTVAKAPYVAPAALTIAPPLGSDEFILVIESPPEHTGDLTLSPRTN